MKFFVCVTLLLLAVDHGESVCQVELQQEGVPGTPTFRKCRDGETWHETGETWINSDCYSCSCNWPEMRCCQTYSTPVQYPEDCIALFDRENCRYRVHKRNDPSIECPVYGSVGK